MFISPKIVYVELHKTGCTHIRNLLKQLLGGEFVGKHNQATADLFREGRFFLGSIRDPWEWYTSLWAYGCDSKGAVFHEVTKNKQSIRGLGWKTNPLAATHRMISLISRDPQKWRNTYADVNDASAFRTWLKMMHDPRHFLDIGEGYGALPMSRLAGLLTFRYIKLHCTKEHEQDSLRGISSYPELKEFEQSQCFIDRFIKNEELAHDLIQSLRDFGITVSNGAESEIRSRPKTNTSSRNHGPEYYYDSDSEGLVAERERLIIEKFGYSGPSQRPR